jgi:hypothetical protein
MLCKKNSHFYFKRLLLFQHRELKFPVIFILLNLENYNLNNYPRKMGKRSELQKSQRRKPKRTPKTP